MSINQKYVDLFVCVTNNTYFVSNKHQLNRCINIYIRLSGQSYILSLNVIILFKWLQ